MEEGEGNQPHQLLLQWVREIPPVSRLYLVLCTATSLACAFDVVSPLSLYFNARLIAKGQVWRLATTFLYFGQPGLDFCLHLYFLNRYSRLLEESPEFLGRTSAFAWMLLFGMAFMALVAPFLNVTFFGSSLTFMMVYVWARRNQDLPMLGFGVLPFRAPYLPWVLFGFSALVGNNPVHSAIVDGLGIAAGHVYYYCEDVYPSVARIRGWRAYRPMKPPAVLRWAFGDDDADLDEVVLLPPANAPNPADAANAANAGARGPGAGAGAGAGGEGVQPI